mmetsp:Transcript_39490/g.98901  ORF Transcript_39490/g.98901 Transcript_39490/m.98901 type:complete len:307 (-) Transcript_39490:223-1143(-)
MLGQLGTTSGVEDHHIHEAAAVRDGHESSVFLMEQEAGCASAALRRQPSRPSVIADIILAVPRWPQLLLYRVPKGLVQILRCDRVDAAILIQCEAVGHGDLVAIVGEMDHVDEALQVAGEHTDAAAVGAEHQHAVIRHAQTDDALTLQPVIHLPPFEELDFGGRVALLFVLIRLDGEERGRVVDALAAQHAVRPVESVILPQLLTLRHQVDNPQILGGPVELEDVGEGGPPDDLAVGCVQEADGVCQSVVEQGVHFGAALLERTWQQRRRLGIVVTLSDWPRAVSNEGIPGYHRKAGRLCHQTEQR